jgi:hypothetical protein
MAKSAMAAESVIENNQLMAKASWPAKKWQYISNQ